MKPPCPQLPRDAEIVARCVFAFGPSSKITFQRPHVIHPRMRAGLDALTDAGMLQVTKDPRCEALTWQRLHAMGQPLKLFRAPGKDESFPFTITEGEAA